MPKAGGAGLVARRDFAVGEEILREAPFIATHPQDEEIFRVAASRGWPVGSYPNPFEIVLEREGTPLQKSQISKMLDAWHTTPTIDGIARTNSIPLGDGGEHGHGLFALICRCNHSCAPNARYIWRQDLGRELLIAIRPISLGGEITVSYLGDQARTGARQAKLRKGFNFTCSCVLCADAFAHSRDAVDDALSESQELDDQVLVVAQTDPERAIRMSKRALALLRSIGYDSGFWTKRHLHDIHQLYAHMGKNRQAREWYEKTVTATRQCEGGNNPEGVSVLQYC